MSVVPSEVTATRRSLHCVAEHVMAGHARRSGGTIRLVVTPTGFGTRPVDGDALALVDGTLQRLPGGPQVPLTGTLGDLALALGVELGMPDPPYPLATEANPDTVLAVDAGALAQMVSALAAGAAAARELSARHGAGEDPVMWPEHLDVSVTVDEVNYGVSPGDAAHEAPYAYVGPFRPRTGEFFNAPFGALRPMADLDGATGVLAFFEEGRAAVATVP